MVTRTGVFFASIVGGVIGAMYMARNRAFAMGRDFGMRRPDATVNQIQNQMTFALDLSLAEQGSFLNGFVQGRERAQGRVEAEILGFA